MQRLLRGALLAAVLAALLVVALGCAPLRAPSPGAAPATNPAPATLHVFAASSLTDAFGEIGAQFTADNPRVELVFNFGGSNQLATQIGEGAPADVFAPANGAQMDAAIATGRVAGDAPQTFARNRLVVVTPSDNPARLTTLQDLATPGVKLVLAAKEVPAGQYALDFLDKAAADRSLGAGYKEAVLANVVSYEENVRTVLTKVALGEADAGIVYASDVAASPVGAVQQIEIPGALNTIVTYPIAVLSDSPEPALAQSFIDAVRSAEGQAVLEQAGFLGAGGE